MSWPSTLTSFSNPTPSDKLNSPSHSSVETAQNTALTELQTFIGVDTGATASAAGTLLYDVKAPGSDGGGHVQTATKGGTGHTTFTAGDILVAQNSSTLTRLAKGSEGQILNVSSAAATGLSWVANTNPKITTNASLITVGVATPTPVLSTSILGSTLGTNNVIKSKVFIRDWDATTSVMVRFQYGSGQVASVKLNAPPAQVQLSGEITTTTIADNATSSQLSYVNLTLCERPSASIQPSVFCVSDFGTSSVNSSAQQPFTITVSKAASGNGLNVRGGYVERLI